MRENIMKRNSKGIYNNIIIIFLLLITVISSNFTVLAENDNGNGESNKNGNPGYKVFPPVVIIKITPAADTDEIVLSTELYEELEDINHKYLQKTMNVKWKENNGSNNITSSAENLEFKIEDSLVLNNEKRNKRFGIKNNNKESLHKIDPEYILVKGKNDRKYSSLDNWVKVLDRDSNSDKLEFKLDKSLFEDEDWRDIEAGVYKSRIKPNLELPGNSGRINMAVIVEPVVKIEVPDKLELNVKEPVNSESESRAWVVNSNKSDISVKFESAGIKLSEADTEDIEKEIDYKAFFKYLVGNNKGSEVTYDSTFAPGTSSEVDFTEGKLKLKYSPDEDGDKEWFELLAGKYKDTVTITVSEN